MLTVEAPQISQGGVFRELLGRSTDVVANLVRQDVLQNEAAPIFPVTSAVPSAADLFHLHPEAAFNDQAGLDVMAFPPLGVFVGERCRPAIEIDRGFDLTPAVPGVHSHGR